MDPAVLDTNENPNLTRMDGKPFNCLFQINYEMPALLMVTKYKGVDGNISGTQLCWIAENLYTI